MDRSRNPLALLVVTLITLISFCACGVTSPGQALNWNSPAAAPSSSSTGSIAVATAPATPNATGPTLSWGAIWNNLNQNTGQVAKGQYALVHMFEGALTSQIDGLLTSAAPRKLHWPN
jgi:hypothetical protein